MRPVNLIPADQRHGQHAPMRTGPLPYLLVGVLVALLAGVALLVSTNNEISEKKSEIGRLEREDHAAEAQAQRLAAYVQFEAVHQQRLETITSLADSRFDWERVMRELALVLPGNVWLSEISASAGAGAGGEGSGSGLSGEVNGPSLVISGCATGQEGVAGFVTALEDLDGVTRVGVEESALPGQAEGSVSAAGGEEKGGGDCQTRDFIAAFSITVAFDAAPSPAVAEGEAPGTAAEGAEETASSTESSGSEGEAEGTTSE